MNLNKISNIYNLTMTYHLNSDILFAYGGIIELATGKKISPAKNIKWKKPSQNFKGLNKYF